MSLKVWLPLNGTLENKGISSTPTSFTSTATYGNGKIGAYAYNTSTASSNTLWPELTGLTTWSVAYWFRCDTSSHTAWADLWNMGVTTSGSTSSVMREERQGANDHNKTCFYFVKDKTIGGNTNTYYSTGVYTGVDTWCHTVITKTPIEGKVYRNGVLVKTIACSNFETSAGTLTGYLQLGMAGSNGFLNDFRVYDHCLSAAEVREISQGLVLHYKLDNIPYNFSTNKVTSFTDFTIGQYYWTIFSINTTDFVSQTGAVNGDKFTFSVDINAKSSTKHLAARMQHFNSSSDRTSVIGNYIDPGQSGRSYITFTLNTAYTRLDFMVNNGDSGSVTANSVEQYKCTRVEKGDVHTGYIAPGITPYIQDSSGYNHNGTITGDITLNSSTPRYSASSLFNGTERITTTTPGADIRTLSCWCKTTKDTNTSQIFVADSFSGMCISFYKNNVIGVFGTTRSTGSKSVLGTAYKAGKWNHIVVVKTGDTGTRDIYCNGIKLTPTTDDYWNSATGFFVGARNASNANPYYGYLSDVRAYVTPLDADAIRQLYEVGAKVDNKQNLHTFELNESNSGRELLAVPLTTSFDNHTNVYTGYDENGEITLTGKKSVGSGYLKINPTGHTYYYDIEMSSDANNVFYVGFECYDANKTARSNQACVYLSGLGGEKTARTHAHYHGTVNLSTDGVNPTDTIALRILNDWSRPSSRKGTIHRISLREVSSLQNSKINKKGQVITDELIELNGNCRIQKNGIIEANEIIEL